MPPRYSGNPDFGMMELCENHRHHFSNIQFQGLNYLCVIQLARIIINRFDLIFVISPFLKRKFGSSLENAFR